MVAPLRPPALDELGLAGALRKQARRLASAAPPLQIDVAVADELENLPTAVEAAAYRIAIEAMTNVARHTQARSCWVRIERNSELCLEITDNGAGTPARQRLGVGIASMVAPAEELPELTRREGEVLELIARGRNNAAIARELVLTEKTVRNHVSNVFTKLHVVDRAEAIIKARAAGLGARPGEPRGA